MFLSKRLELKGGWICCGKRKFSVSFSGFQKQKQWQKRSYHFRGSENKNCQYNCNGHLKSYDPRNSTLKVLLNTKILWQSLTCPSSTLNSTAFSFHNPDATIAYGHTKIIYCFPSSEVWKSDARSCDFYVYLLSFLQGQTGIFETRMILYFSRIMWNVFLS